jgi:hypothetical protein
LRWGFANVLPGLDSVILLISASRVARITSINHQHQVLVSPHKEFLTSVITLFSYMCMKYFDHIHSLPPSLFTPDPPLAPTPKPFCQSLILNCVSVLFLRARFCIWQVVIFGLNLCILDILCNHLRNKCSQVQHLRTSICLIITGPELQLSRSYLVKLG